MRFGIIGFGKIARKFVKSVTYSNGNEVVAIGSRSIKEDDPYLLENPHVKVFSSYDDLLAFDLIDAVYIAVPHKYHYEWIVKALENKKAVLCEKPAVLSSEQMKHIKEVAVENHTPFLEALKTKMNESFLSLKNEIDCIGKIESIEANFCFDGLALKNSGTYLFEADQGGALNDVGTYLLGFTLTLVKDEVISISSEAKMVDGVDEHFMTHLTFKNGCVAHLEGAIDQNKERYALIKGEKGCIMVPMFNRMIDYTITFNDKTTLTRNFPIVGDDMTYQINVLKDCVNKQTIESPLHTFDEMIEMVQLTEQIRATFK